MSSLNWLRALLQCAHQLLDLGFQPGDALSGEQVHAGRLLEVRQFPLEGEQALASGSDLGGLLACCWQRVV